MSATNNEQQSPLGWSPKQSPPHAKARLSSSLQNDDLSMTLFGGSFDSFEPALRATFDREPPPSEARHEADLPLGHISPIKVSYNDAHSAEPYDDANWPCDNNGNVHPPVSNPLYVIRFAAGAFSQVKYRLACLRGTDPGPVINMNHYGQIRQYKAPSTQSASLLETEIATLRVEAAICAFGGRIQSKKEERRRQHPESIFRLKTWTKSTIRRNYEQSLPKRYSLSGGRISWDFEEDPPVVVPAEEKDDASVASSTRDLKKSHEQAMSGGSSQDCLSHTPKTFQSPQDTTTNSKMKYRCKQCGQLKNNHICPYRQPLQRSIGIMVYPALNSFTAFEPGTVAPPLTNMNNFVSYSESEGNSQHPGAPSTSDQAQATTHDTAAAITPEAFSEANGNFYRAHSPQSSLSGHSEDGPKPGVVSHHRVTGNIDKLSSRKRHHDHVDARDDNITAKRSLFVTSVHLRPEHYRSVTQSSQEDSPGSYEYATIPLTFAERKRLSDTLFFLSKEVETSTQDCARVLREARENNEWDTAVAELLTQIIVGLFCTEEDYRLDGLQRYLLALGISC
mmetsp:Transcript_4348/g.9337  ORF Transcript_4348/g.9337 Transcript_4348/m.9337 type:complete len:564 (-) Transcript_4348:89-1780(-)|eukprot:CAMPEP_0172476354 /NCGR_PEP_ID=MMETSP1065-20121228/70336_1 /TAXON_ID=265537 /ORGANISM="Amphiprora paludosa, Strain CCMP125" /LENGTH=563 /DNA_ID=CAMNT_0013234575 /DNA_START=124 /DNA_END=1815 /DNA_ORIENTATION=-